MVIANASHRRKMKKNKRIKNIDKKENNRVENKEGRRGKEKKKKLILREGIGVTTWALEDCF